MAENDLKTLNIHLRAFASDGFCHQLYFSNNLSMAPDAELAVISGYYFGILKSKA